MNWMPQKTTLAVIIWMIHGLGWAGIYNGLTTPQAYTDLLNDVNAMHGQLAAKIALADGEGINTDYAQSSLVTIELFKDTFAPWDYANQGSVDSMYQAKLFMGSTDPVYATYGAVGLPFDELSDCLEVATNAIDELDEQIAGTIVLQDPPDFSTGGVSLNGTHFQQNGKTVLPHYFFWHPYDEDIMQAFGRMGEGYYAITDMASSNTVKSWRYSDFVNLMQNQNTDNRAPIQFFLGHVDYNNSWHRSNHPDAFNVGARLFTDYDIDHPYVPGWLDQLFDKMLDDAVTASGSQERIHMIANEPVWSIRNGGVDADEGVSSYTYAKFETWLQDKYTTISNLNAVWGTGHADFAAAATAYYGSNGVSTGYQGGPIWYDWCRFNMKRVMDWFTYLHNSVSTTDPAGHTHIKLMGERSVHTQYQDEGLDFEAIIKLVDMPGSDNQMSSARAEYNTRQHVGDWKNRYNMEWIKQSIMIDFVKSICPEKAFYDAEWHGLSGSRWRDFHMEPEYVRAALWMAATHGVSAMNAWVWNRHDNGSIDTRADFIGTTVTQPLQLDAWGRTMKELNAHGDAVASLVPDERYYMVYYCRDSAIQDSAYTEKMENVYESLKLLNVPVGFTTPSELSIMDVSTQTLIISPTAYISDVDVTGLQNFVSSGGKIILVDPLASFIRDELGVTRPGGVGSVIPWKTMAYGSILDMVDDFETALASRRPTLPVEVEITTPGGSPEYGVMATQYSDPAESNQVVCLINVHKDPRNVTLSLQSGDPVLFRNLLTGQSHAASFTMAPQDVLLLSTWDGIIDDPLWDEFVLMYSLSGVKTNNADSDMVNDWGEYAFDGNPTNPADIGTLPVFNPATGEYVFDLRNDTNIVACVVTKTDLLDADWTTNQTITASVHDGSMETHVSATGTAETNLFIKLLLDEGADPVTPPPHQVVIGEGGSIGVPSSGNGNFEASTGTGNGYAISLMPNWFNLSGAESQTCGTDVGMWASPEPDSQGCWPYQTFLLGNDTGYTVQTAGETFHLSLACNAHGTAANYNGDERIVVQLFTSTTPGVDVDTGIGHISILSTTKFTIGTWGTESADNVYTTTAGDVGKTIYLGLTLENPTTPNVWPRCDVIKMEVNK